MKLDEDSLILTMPLPARVVVMVLAFLLVVATNANLAYMMTNPVSTVPLTESASTVVESTGSESEDMADNTEIEQFCSINFIDCSSEGPIVRAQQPTTPMKVVPTLSTAVTVDSNKLATLRKVCTQRGLGERCAKVLYAMHMQETRGNCNALGDYLNGKPRSVGCFQIQLKLHRVSKEVATNFEKSAEWALNHLISHGLKDGKESYAIRRFNGDGPMSFRYLSEVKEKIASLK